MTKEELKEKNPAVYNQAFNEGFATGKAEGKEAGKAEEHKKTVAWMDAWINHFNGDKEAAVKAIQEGLTMDSAKALKEDLEYIRSNS
ncbi:FliH/SctL family protein [Marinilabilia salmonicolor]|uniref:hypothetical protein n=1 Tax=Marinilabilia salmonicolor TaxID=989 RepID=UPI00029A6FBC|nr:hypothetical protein [Marinilabilia salmonicolor]